MVNLEGSTTGAKAQNAEFFAADLIVQENTEHWIIAYTTSAAVILHATHDSGTSWNILTTLTVADTYTLADLYVKKGDTVNFRTPTASGATVDVFDVIKVEG